MKADQLTEVSSRLKEHLNRQTSQWPVIFARVYLGWFFLQAGLNKLSKGELGIGYTESLEGFVTGTLERATSWYRPLLETIVLPNAELFSILVSWGETLMGIALITGTVCRFATLVGMFMTANFAMAQGRGLSLPGMDAAIFWTMLSLFFLRPGLVLGGDALISRFFGRNRGRA